MGPNDRRKGRSIPNALHRELPYTDPPGRIAPARPPARPLKNRRVMHDPG